MSETKEFRTSSETSGQAHSSEELRLWRHEADHVVPQLSSRMLVDLVNGLDTSSNLIRARSVQTAIGRFVGFLDGSNQRRDTIIAQQHQRSLEVLQTWALELTHFGQQTAETLTEVVNRLQDVRKVMGCMGNVLERHEKELAAIRQTLLRQLEVQQAQHRLLDAKVEAHFRLEQVMASWEGGGLFCGYPPLVSLFLAYDDLRRGPHGATLFGEERYREVLVDRGVRGLCMYLSLKPDEVVPFRQVLQQTSNSMAPIKIECSNYLLTRDTQEDESLRGVLALSVRDELDKETLIRRQQEGYVPGICRLRIVVKQLMREVTL